MSASAAPLPQLTPRAVVLGLVLSVVLAGANAYLGLFAGMTVAVYRVANERKGAR